MRRIFALLLCLSLLPVSAPERTKYVALTFDDGPSGKYTRTLLDGLQERGVKATFFLCGYRIQDYPEETARIVSEGHEVGCHGFSHKSMDGMSRRDIGAEIADTLALLPEGTQVTFLRPPGGKCSPAVLQVAQAKQLSVLSWSVDPRDWATDDTASIEQRVLENVHDGDVILLHDMSYSSVRAALDIIDALSARGFQFVTASRLAILRGYSLQPGKDYSSFPVRDASAFSGSIWISG